ncbi:MAG: TorF family putative porin [Phycisphaeraceae bacterium]
MKSTTLTRMFSTAAILGVLATPALAQEGEEGIFIPGASAEVTLDYVTQYFFRGYEQLDSDQGIVLQPGASFTIDVVEDVTATVGTWGSIHTDMGPASTASNPSSWYEQDVYASLDAALGDFSVGVGINTYTYPALATSSVVELAATVGFDDSDLLGDFAFAPYITIATELNNTNTLNGGKEATYLEIGGEFGIPTEGTPIEAWSWSVPVAVGLSIDDYYVDGSGAEEFFGFASIGLAGSIPLSELLGTDEYVGAWDLSVGVTLLLLNADIPGQVDNADNTGDNFQVVGTVGISRGW